MRGITLQGAFDSLLDSWLSLAQARTAYPLCFEGPLVSSFIIPEEELRLPTDPLSGPSLRAQAAPCDPTERCVFSELFL